MPRVSRTSAQLAFFFLWAMRFIRACPGVPSRKTAHPAGWRRSLIEILPAPLRTIPGNAAPLGMFLPRSLPNFEVPVGVVPCSWLPGGSIELELRQPYVLVGRRTLVDLWPALSRYQSQACRMFLPTTAGTIVLPRQLKRDRSDRRTQTRRRSCNDAISGDRWP